MNFFTKFIAQILPTNDMKVIELRRTIKNQKQRISYLEGQLEEQLKGIPIQFYDEEIEDRIIENLRTSEKEICIAMAWLTSENIMRVLNELKNRGVHIKIVVDNNNNNNKVRLWNPCSVLKMAQVGGRNNFMHNKYCIIDNVKVIDGSYNWSKNAKRNLEHIIVIEDKNTAKKYKDAFNKIFNNPRYYANYTITENVV